MARYNAWQNGWVFAACDGLPDAARRQDRGLFFRTIHATLSHVLWGDHMWLARFTGGDIPAVPQRQSGSYVDDWDCLKAARSDTDAALSTWAATVGQDFLDADYSWYSGSAQARISRPMAQVVAHLFNHQTHHRGQVHAALTQAGHATQDTDLFYMEPA
nr:DinB family protein [Palleronia pontilimi]